MATDPSILSGTPEVSQGGALGAPPSTVGQPEAAPIGAAPSPAPVAATAADAAASAARPTTPRPWMGILQGALWGLMGASQKGPGRPSFGAGLGLGVKGAEEGATRRAQLQFESAQAADSHIKALDEHRRAEQLDDTGKLDLVQKTGETNAYFRDQFGWEPFAEIPDTHAATTGALTTAAAANGGAIPAVSTLQAPGPKGKDGKIFPYTMTPDQAKRNSEGYLAAVNRMREVQGVGDIDPAIWARTPYKDQQGMALQVPTFFNPNVNLGDNPAAVVSHLETQLANYQKHTDPNGNPDADAATIKRLEDQLDSAKKTFASQGQQKTEADLASKNLALQKGQLTPEGAQAIVGSPQNFSPDRVTEAKNFLQTGTELAGTKAYTEEKNRLKALTEASNPGGNAPLTPEMQVRIDSLPDAQKALLNRYDSNTQANLMSVAFGNGEQDFDKVFPPSLRPGQPGLTKQAAMGVLTQLNPQFSEHTYRTKMKMYDSATTGDLSKQAGSLNNFIGHAAEAKAILNDFYNSKTQFWNSTLRDISSKFGGQDVDRLKTAADVVTSEFGTMVKAGFAPTAEEVAANHRLLDAMNQTPGQMSADIGVMANMGHTRANTINNQYKTATNGAQFPNLIYPENVQHAKDIGMDVTGLNSGGTIASSGNAPQNQQNPNPGKYIPPPNSKPVIVNGVTVGDTLDGKTMIPRPKVQ